VLGNVIHLFATQVSRNANSSLYSSLVIQNVSGAVYACHKFDALCILDLLPCNARVTSTVGVNTT